MPKLIFPKSDGDQVGLLDMCITNEKSIYASDQKCLSEDFIIKIEKFEREFKINHLEIVSSFAHLGKGTREKGEVIHDLTIRDFFEVLHRRKKHNKYLSETFTMYDLRLSG